MSTLLDLPDRLTPPADAPVSPEPSPSAQGGDGFVDCRGVFHAWDEEDD
jgi:hypothetical protein